METELAGMGCHRMSQDGGDCGLLRGQVNLCSFELIFREKSSWYPSAHGCSLVSDDSRGKKGKIHRRRSPTGLW